MDSFTVSICGGMTMNPVRLKSALRIAFFFGVFQALMPVVGWFGGSRLTDLIAGFDHWVAFGLLGLIGARMIHEATRGQARDREINVASVPLLLMLSVATSIDALAVGLSFAFLNVSITRPVIAIGIVAGALSLLGVYLGRRYGSLLGSKAEVVGGAILIGIGVKILVEHLAAAPPAIV